MKSTRRSFCHALAGAGSLALAQTPEPWAGAQVIDCHFHFRPNLEANIAHLDGCRISNALVFARESAAEQVAALRSRYPGRVPGWFASADITKPEAEKLLTTAVRNGASGFGELKFRVEAAGPELQRMYALAAELNVPILVHFQEVPHFEGEGVFATGWKNFEAMLKRYPKTKFVGHADAFWANVSADYANESAYPAGKIKPGGVTDKLLSGYANLYGDLSANSGNNALSRDAEFTPDFLKRHQDKLIFGSDCSCADGRGGGVSQQNNPAASRLAGKCVARETLGLLHRTVTAGVFRKLTWENAQRVYALER